MLLYCVLGLRDIYTVGNDVNAYRMQFESMKDTEWSELGGPFDWLRDLEEQNGKDEKNVGLQYLMKFIYDQTDGDFQALAMVVAFIVILANAHVVRRYSPDPLQSILYFLGLLYFSLHFSAMKQSVAMSFVLFSFDAIIDRRPLKFFILLVCASIFHYPALVFLPAYWIGNMRLGRSYLILLAIIMIVVYLYRDNIVGWMNNAYYGDESDHTVATNTRFLMNKVIVMLIIIAAALVIRPPHPSDRLYCTLLALMGVATVIQTFAGYGNIFERLADYYFQFAFVFIPMVFEDVKLQRQYFSPRMQAMVRRVAPYIFCAFAIWRFLNSTSYDANMNQFQFYFQAERAEELLNWRPF